MIDIIIPVYNSRKYLPQALSSIYMQTIRDEINVIIVDDNGVERYNDICGNFKNMGLNIRLLSCKNNCGPGIARQIGIDNSNSEFIMFMDSDDCLYSPLSVSTLYNQIKNSKYDVVYSDFVEENADGSIGFKRNWITWLFGKMYRRDFLVKHNINFRCPYNRSNEDAFFNFKAMITEDFEGEMHGSCYVSEITYFWRYNENSITRSNNFSYKEGYEGFCHNMVYLINVLEDKYGKDKIWENVLNVMTVIYSNYNQFLYNPDITNEEWDNINKNTRYIFKSFSNYVEYMTPDNLAQSIHRNIPEIVSLYCPKITPSDLINRFLEVSNQKS